MKIAIRHRWNDSVLFEGDFESASKALEAAVAARAYLSGANLSGADLSRAYLSGANLSGANLSRAYLSGANLSGATGCSPDLTTPLRMLLDQPKGATLRAYKLVDKDYGSPMAPGQGHQRLVYTIGAEVEARANDDATADCAAGVNVASLDWCLRNWKEGYKILIVEFKREDIACVPDHSDGKFRVHRVKVIEEKQLDYAQIFPKYEAPKPEPQPAQGGQAPIDQAQGRQTTEAQTPPQSGT